MFVILPDRNEEFSWRNDEDVGLLQTSGGERGAQ